MKRMQEILRLAKEVLLDEDVMQRDLIEMDSLLKTLRMATFQRAMIAARLDRAEAKKQIDALRRAFATFENAFADEVREQERERQQDLGKMGCTEKKGPRGAN